MKRKIVLYGLGDVYAQNENEINMKYIDDEISYCDKDLKKIEKYSTGISTDYLKEHIEEYDQVIITTHDILNIFSYLINDLEIVKEKIKWFFADEHKNKHTEIEFYGEHLEDAVLLQLIKDLGLQLSNIKYLEIGTNNPIYGNNTFVLYCQGMSGVLIDPLPVVEALSKIVRPKDQFISAAVTDFADANQTAVFYECSDAALSSLEEYHHFGWNNMNLVKQYDVAVLGINDILKGLKFVPDILLIDAEGYDDKIIRGIDFNRYKPKIIMVEIYDMLNEQRVDLLNFMVGKGYVLYTVIKNVNAIFKVNSEAI